MPIGCKVTLRGSKMYEFADRLINLALPRVRDFRGVNPNAFDGRGNYALGVKEQLIFPEIEYDKIDKVRGIAASADNTGNFFGQNLFLAAGGLLLIKGVMEQLGYSVELTDMVLYGLPTAVCAYIVNFIRFIIFDKTIQASVARDEEDMKAGKLVPNEFNILVTPEELKKEAE